MHPKDLFMHFQKMVIIIPWLTVMKTLELEAEEFLIL